VPRGEGETPTRGIRVPEKLWRDAQRVCGDRGTTVNREIVRFLERMVRNHPLPEGED
jgi:antitoxin component of RelBE/YafQ-DinJ toxin-antitoxin module